MNPETSKSASEHMSYERLILEAYDITIRELRGFTSEIDLDEDTGRLMI